MSEYQLYDFAAVDGPISDKGLQYARGCSSRAEVSPYRWRNVYHFGDFHGSVDTLLKYYDAHFYTANWGTVRLGLALPAGCLNPEAVQPYLHGGESCEDTLTVQRAGARTVIWWERNEEDGSGWTEGESALDQLIAVREDLMRGDYRALFLGWLADFDPDEWRDPKGGGVLMPPVPPGLDVLSPALRELIEQFPVDRDALAAAIGLSKTTTADRIPIATVLERLSVSEMRGLLARVTAGDGPRVMADLNRLTCPRPETTTSPTMTCADFAARTTEVRAARRSEDAVAAAEKRAREEQARRQHLVAVMQRAGTIWSGLDPLMDQKVALAYDQAAAQLEQLRDAHKQAGEDARFEANLAAFRKRYAHRPAMIRRIKDL